MVDTILMYDSTTASNVTRLADVRAGTAAAAGYCDANFAAVWIDMVHSLPQLAAKQWVCSIGTRAGTVCRIFDVEPGNPLSPAQAAEQVVAMVRKGVYRPGIYCSGDSMTAAREALARTGLKRAQYTLFLANPTGVRPTAQWLLANGLDALQYAWASKGQAPAGTDISAVLPDFFPAAKPDPKPKPHNNMGEAAADLRVNLRSHKMEIHGTTGQHVVFAGKRQTLHFHGSLEIGDGGGHWHIHKGLVLPRLKKGK